MNIKDISHMLSILTVTIIIYISFYIFWRCTHPMNYISKDDAIELSTEFSSFGFEEHLFSEGFIVFNNSSFDNFRCSMFSPLLRIEETFLIYFNKST